MPATISRLFLWVLLVMSPGLSAQEAGKDAQWHPTDAQVQLIVRQTYAYFAAKDAGKFQEAYALMSPAQKNVAPFDGWTASSGKFNLEAGPVVSRAIRKVTWYKDPPGAAPGIYAAVDYLSKFANVDIHCGYVVWNEQVDGSFLLVREEQNYISRDMQQKIRPEDLEKVRAQFGC